MFQQKREILTHEILYPYGGLCYYWLYAYTNYNIMFSGQLTLCALLYFRFLHRQVCKYKEEHIQFG